MLEQKSEERIHRLHFLLARLDAERKLFGYRGGEIAEEIRAKHEQLWRAELALLLRGRAA